MNQQRKTPGGWTVKNKTIIVSGATSGIGRPTALELARQGATVVLAVRDERKAKETVVSIQQQAGHNRVDYLLVDFASQSSIRHMANQFLNRYDQLDVLVNNHGTVNIRRRETEDGLEKTFAVNHLGYFLLTNLLLDRIQASAPARIINVSSAAHWGAKLEFDNLQLRRGYAWGNAYGRSKLANILFTIELAGRLQGTGVTANALHPGWVATSLGADNIPIIGGLVKAIINLTAKSPEKGAETSIYLVTSPEVSEVTGQYFVNCQPARTSAAAQDKDTARRLWRVSEELTGLS